MTPQFSRSIAMTQQFSSATWLRMVGEGKTTLDKVIFWLCIKLQSSSH